MAKHGREEHAAMTSQENEGAVLVLGPMLRYAGETQATVWVETDRECLVEILGRRRGPSRWPGTTTASWCLTA